MAGIRKRDWLMAAALVPYLVVMLPVGLVGTVLMFTLVPAWGSLQRQVTRKRARSCAIARSDIKSGPIRTLTATKV